MIPCLATGKGGIEVGCWEGQSEVLNGMEECTRELREVPVMG